MNTQFPYPANSLQTILPNGTFILTSEIEKLQFETIVIDKQDIEKFNRGDLEEGVESVSYNNARSSILGHQMLVNKYLDI